jgi:autotransporter-associated beta strand protein
MCYTGGVTGANALYLENIPDSKGDDGIRFQTGSIDMTNKLVHIGAGGGTCTVDSVIGPNVTEVIQDSGTSPLVLGGANTYTGNTTVVAGTLAVNNLNALQNSTLDTGAAGSQRVTFTVAGNNTYNLGGLTGSDVVDVGGNTLGVGASGALAPGSAGVGTLTVTGAVTVVEGAVYQWQCQNGVGDLLELKGASGTLTLPAVATVQVSQISGDLPSTPTLFTAAALSGPGAADLSGWTVSGLDGYTVHRQGTSVILGYSAGTIFRCR